MNRRFFLRTLSTGAVVMTVAPMVTLTGIMPCAPIVAVGKPLIAISCNIEKITAAMMKATEAGKTFQEALAQMARANELGSQRLADLGATAKRMYSHAT